MPICSSFSGYTGPLTRNFVPVIPSFLKPRRFASLPTSSAMCSHGNGERGKTNGSASWIVLSGQIRKSAPARFNASADRNINSATGFQPAPESIGFMYSARANRVHGSFRMRMPAHQRAQLPGISSGSKRRTFRAATDNANVLCHARKSICCIKRSFFSTGKK